MSSITKVTPDGTPQNAAGPPRGSPPRRPVSLRTIAKSIRRGEKFACLTCYDATTARWLERAGVPVLLVGDTAAEMILGLPGTIHAPLELLIMLTAAVKRGAPNTLVMADMPFMSYQADEAEGLRNAGRFMTEGRADVVKLEVDRSFAGLVEKMARAGVPVVADESVASLEDAWLARGFDACDAATLKLAKVGGIGAAMEIAGVLPAYLSSALDGPIGIAAAAHLAQALPSSGFASGLAQGLATAELFAVETAKTAALLDGGSISPPDGPGLGVVLDEAVLESLRI